MDTEDAKLVEDLCNMNFFEFNKNDYERICEECMLDEEYQKLLEYKIKGYTIVKIADLLNCSQARVSIMIKKLKRKIRRII